MPRTVTTPDPERQLMIKTKACQRLVKEVDYYKKEVQENESKLATLKEEERNPYDIKKFEEVLGESYMMVPDSEKRLRKYLEDLQQFLLESEEMVTEQQAEPSQWVLAAQEMLKQHTSDSNIRGETCDVEETNVDDLKDDEAF